MSSQSASSSAAGDAARSISTSLLVRIQASEPDAWQRFVFLFEPLVQAWCERAGLQRADAADVCQEVFRAVAGAVGEFERREGRSTFRGWLYRIAQNKVRDHWRRKLSEPAADGGSAARVWLAQLPAGDDESDARLAPSERQELLRRGLELVRAEFQEKTWQAFWRVTVEEQPAAEVAAALGISAGAVYIAKSRVLARLREELAGLDALDESE